MAPRNNDASSSSRMALVASLVTAGSIVVVSMLSYRVHQVERKAKHMKEQRMAERTGRIRAEVRLRTLLKEQAAKETEQEQSLSLNTTKKQHAATPAVLQGEKGNSASLLPEDSQTNGGNKGMYLTCIGTVVSPYTKRMGTPRQGALAPDSRGFVQLHIDSCPVECVSNLDDYSHVWIIFEFHANTNMPYSNSKSTQKTKVRPPRGGGIKVGQLATRSPHRPNAIGLSLVKMVKIDEKERRVHIAALDLVHGTPVYDIKPCVPWDAVPPEALRVPPWVSQDDALARVDFVPKSLEDLERHVEEGHLAPLYTDENDGFSGAVQTIQQVLAQDPRASNKRGSTTKTKSSGGGGGGEDDTYRIVFCSVQVEFAVYQQGVSVVGVCPVELNESSFVDGIPLLAAGVT